MPAPHHDGSLWRCSQRLSWFAQRGALYVYHDLFGDILEMSSDVRALLAAFRAPRPLADAAALTAWDAQTLTARLQTLRDHDCLVPDSDPNADTPAALLDRYPVRARWVVTYLADDGTLLAVTGRNPQTPPRLLTLSASQAAAWRLADGARTVAEVAAAIDAPPAEVAAWFSQWTHSEAQLTRIDRVSARFYDQHTPRPPYLTSTMPFPPAPALDLTTQAPTAHAHEADAVDAVAAVDLRRYHQEVISDAMHQFDEVETTLSHLFRSPHPALGGDTYAGRMLEALRARDMLPADALTAAEVGGGVGAFAAGFLTALRSRCPQQWAQTHYTIFDISPALNASQSAQLSARGLCPQGRAVLADAESLDLPPNSLDLLISNEVIGDLRTAFVQWTPTAYAGALADQRDEDEKDDEEDEEPPWFDPDSPPPPDPDDPDASAPPTLTGEPSALEVIDRLQLDLSDAPIGAPFAINEGALRLVERLWSWLRPGGAAILTEFGDLWRYPVESTHLDHAEFSIHFGLLQRAAAGLGFAAEVVDVFDLLGFDGSVEVLASTRTYQRNLSFFLSQRGVPFEKVAYTRPAFEALLTAAGLTAARLDTLQFQPLEQRVMGLVPREFKALLLRKPPL
jgi:hypothetical protein